MDPITIIEDHVLLPDRHNWAEGGPEWTLSWDTQEEAALRGNEGRSAMRLHPRPKLGYAIWSRDLQAASLHQARVRRGLALGGSFCCPHHGRASWLAVDAEAGATQVSLLPTPWPWAVGKRLLLPNTGEGASVHQITAVAGNVLTLDSALPAAIPADAPVHPLFFGRMETKTGEEIWSPDAPVSRIELTGDSYPINSTSVPLCCQPAIGPSLSCEELMNLWQTVDQGGAVAVEMSTEPPAGHKRHGACLRFVRVVDGNVVGTPCGEVSSAVLAAVLAAAGGGDGYYAVEFYGSRGPKTSGHPSRLWISGSDNYKIYLLNMA